MKTLIAVSVLAAILIAGCVNQVGPSSESEITVHDSVEVEVIQGDFILEDTYIDMLNEEMNSGMDQSDFDQMQESMASDLSQFYYE